MGEDELDGLEIVDEIDTLDESDFAGLEEAEAIADEEAELEEELEDEILDAVNVRDACDTGCGRMSAAGQDLCGVCQGAEVKRGIYTNPVK